MHVKAHFKFGFDLDLLPHGVELEGTYQFFSDRDKELIERRRELEKGFASSFKTFLDSIEEWMSKHPYEQTGDYG